MSFESALEANNSSTEYFHEHQSIENIDMNNDRSVGTSVKVFNDNKPLASEIHQSSAKVPTNQGSFSLSWSVYLW